MYEIMNAHPLTVVIIRDYAAASATTSKKRFLRSQSRVNPQSVPHVSTKSS
jgi:hypothetical protein